MPRVSKKLSTTSKRSSNGSRLLCDRHSRPCRCSRRRSIVARELAKPGVSRTTREELHMSTPGTPSLAPIALQRDHGEALWAFGGLAVIKASSETTEGRVFVVETLAPRGAGSPLHVHHREDEWFYVTEGELTFWVGGQVINAPAGSFVYGPRDIPHTFDVVSDEARFL